MCKNYHKIWIGWLVVQLFDNSVDVGLKPCLCEHNFFMRLEHGDH